MAISHAPAVAITTPRTSRTGRRVLFFGTYDARRYPRVRVLQEGFGALGDDVLECNVPLRLDTAARVRMLRRPWLVPLLAARLAATWIRLIARSRRFRGVDLIVVGYMGHFDVHLARLLWPRTPVALDHLVSARDTALDRRVSSGWLVRLLERLDRAAVNAAHFPCVDTAEHRDRVCAAARARSVVVPVGAPSDWFYPPVRSVSDRVRVVFFGSFTPLQGAPVIGEALRLLADDDRFAFTIVGRGQDYEETRAAAGAANAEWIDWVEPEQLPYLVACHDICLGIFGTGPKALRVVPNKVFQGAAAGTAILTSDTPPQRQALGNAAAYAPAGDALALAAELRTLAGDRRRLWELRVAAFARASEQFHPAAVIEALNARLPAPAAVTPARPVAA
ncbi:MAG: glycosyltransferase family 4 protein [Actinobacteria bacterium]|nr:MAG: glycosyltransferase family 4 protein [Actinomycetota bacterium]